MLDIIANPFITIMTVLYGVTGHNTVLAIAVMTIAIRLLTSPLLMQQQKSTQAMQELQPKLNSLKEKYKDDREKLAQAQMALYREHGINPLGGCLPLVIQLPILLGLYQAIIYALAGTPSQLIDLSERLLLPRFDNLVPLNNIWSGLDLTLAPTANPSYALILPVLVMATTWLQSRLTIPVPPPSEDGKPNQAATMTRTMTTIMPLMFGFFSLFFPAGLTLYIFTNTTLTLIHYYFVHKEDRVAARADKLAKKAGTFKEPDESEDGDGAAEDESDGRDDEVASGGGKASGSSGRARTGRNRANGSDDPTRKGGKGSRGGKKSSKKKKKKKGASGI